MPSTKVTAPVRNESITVVDGGAAVLVERGDASRRIPARWLRLLSNDPANVHSESGQRLFDSVTLPSEIRVRTATFDEEQGNWAIRFESETTTVTVEIDHLLDGTGTENVDGPQETPFSSADPPVRSVDFETLEAPAALRSFLETLFRRGYARVRGVPCRAGELERFARRLGLDGSLGWGGAFEEHVTGDGVVPVNASRDSAPHTDEPYRDPIPPFHVQHCLETSGSGGEVIVVDGLSVAATLAAEEPLSAVELTRWPMLFKYRDQKHDLQRAMLLLETRSDGSLRRITFNDRAASDFVCPDDRLPICAEAYDRLARLVLREGMQNVFRMQAGDLLIFDNERVLHGRRPITGGTRRLSCCYLDRTDLLSTWRLARSGDLD